MTAIDRRALLRVLLSGGVVAAAGLTAATSPAWSMPLPTGAARAPAPEGATAPENIVEKAVVVVRRRRRVRRRVCWWRRGRRVCRWRWVWV